MCVILHLSTERLQTVVSSHLAMYLCTVKDTPTSVVRIVIVYCRCLNTQQPSPNNDLSIATNEQNLLFCTPFFSMARQPLGGLGRHIFRGFTITLFRHITLGRTPLDEGPARRRDLYLTTHNTHKRQTSMP